MFPNVIVLELAPKALALVVPRTVPESMVRPWVKVLTPSSCSWEVLLFSTTPVTLVPIIALISVEPLPVPALVTVPVLLTEVPETVILAVELLLSSIRLPVPVILPEIVSPLPALTSVVPPLLTAKPPLTVSAAAPTVLLLLMILVTFEPIPPLIVTAPVPEPVSVTVPALLTLAVEKVIVPDVALGLMVRLFVPVTPPLNVPEIAVPKLEISNRPVVLEASTIGLV